MRGLSRRNSREVRLARRRSGTLGLLRNLGVVARKGTFCGDIQAALISHLSS